VADEFLTVAEIAELLKLNPMTIRNVIDRGDLPAVRWDTAGAGSPV
jgi:excisionase family DNA binding protein